MSRRVQVTIDSSRDQVHLTPRKNNANESDITLELYRSSPIHVSVKAPYTI